MSPAAQEDELNGSSPHGQSAGRHSWATPGSGCPSSGERGHCRAAIPKGTPLSAAWPRVAEPRHRERERIRIGIVPPCVAIGKRESGVLVMDCADLPAIQHGNELICHGRFFRESRMLLMSTFLGSLAADAFSYEQRDDPRKHHHGRIFRSSGTFLRSRCYLVRHLFLFFAEPLFKAPVTQRKRWQHQQIESG